MKAPTVPAGSTCCRGAWAVAQAALSRRKAAARTAVRRTPGILLAGLLLLCLSGLGRRLLALFDQSFDLLAALLTDRLVELRAVAVASCLAALLAALLADSLVECVAMG